MGGEERRVQSLRQRHLYIHCALCNSRRETNARLPPPNPRPLLGLIEGPCNIGLVQRREREWVWVGLGWIDS